MLGVCSTMSSLIPRGLASLANGARVLGAVSASPNVFNSTAAQQQRRNLSLHEHFRYDLVSLYIPLLKLDASSDGRKFALSAVGIPIGVLRCDGRFHSCDDSNVVRRVHSFIMLVSTTAWRCFEIKVIIYEIFSLTVFK